MDLTLEFEKFVKDIQKLRLKAKSKKVTYPEKLRKKALELIEAGIRSKDVVSEAGISQASLTAWARKYGKNKENAPCEADIIPLRTIGGESRPVNPSESEHKLSLQVICVRVDVAQTDLTRTLNEVMAAVGGAK